MAAGNTYTPIATNTLVSATASVSFASIPNTYTDLIWVIQGTCTANNIIALRFNDTWSGIGGYNYYNGSSALSYNNTNAYLQAGNPTDRFHIVGFINNYANTTTYKTFFARTNTPSSSLGTYIGTQKSTSAITKITFDASNFASGTIFTLYGVTAA